MRPPLFYSNLVPLDKEKHKAHKLKKQDSYAFAVNANSIPVAGFEFFEASRNFPIFFVKGADGIFIPVAILSLRKAGHDLGEKWEDAYVPAYLRRYPFILSAEGVVLFDEPAPHVQAEEGEDLFDENGEPTEVAKGIIKFLEQIDRGYRLTEEFARVLGEKELLEPFKGSVKLSEGSVSFGDLYSINEKKMHEVLTEADVYEWFKKGWLAWSLAHLHSIGSINEILIRARNAAEKSQ